ncbi:MAG: putative solute:sodium symporter small subunit domain protein [Ramlibacter sp.]|nr:putative solute:sodium symporter small subunit domain protein [Ramlibacter sp.]
MDDQGTTERLDRRVLALKAGLLALWAAVSFGATFFARDLQFSLAQWPFSYWFAAQGALLAFIAIVVFYAWAMRRLAPEDSAGEASRADGG